MKFQIQCFILIFYISFALCKSYKELYELKQYNKTEAETSNPDTVWATFLTQHAINKNVESVSEGIPKDTSEGSKVVHNPIVPHNQINVELPKHDLEKHSPNSTLVTDQKSSNVSSNPKETNLENRIYYAYGHEADKNSANAEERSSYISYTPDIVPQHKVEVPEGQYYSYPLTQDNNNEAYPKQDLEEGEEDKEEYFYHKGKFIVKLIYGLFALHATLFAANFMYATFTANFYGVPGFGTNPFLGRKKRDTSDHHSGGGVGFGTNLSCVAKFLCELEQMEELFGIKKTPARQQSEKVRNQERDQGSKPEGDEEEKSENLPSQRIKRRPRRQIFEKRNCSKIYNTCNINYSLFINLYRFLLRIGNV